MKTKIQLTKDAPFDVPADAVLLFCYEEDAAPVLSDRARARALGKELARRGFKGDAGRLIRVVIGDGPHRRDVVVSGFGPRARANADGLLKSVAGAARVAYELRAGSIAVAPPAAGVAALGEGATLRLTTQALRLAGYRFDRYVSEARGKPRPEPPARTLLCVPPTAALRRGVREAETISDGVALARDLVNEPAGAMTPLTFASVARGVARKKGLWARVLGPREIKQKRMGALASVAQGSAVQPRVVHLRYSPSGRPKARVALVGKGVTFDSGGYNLKTGTYINDMKCDMAGAAAVLAATQVIAQLAPSVEVHAVVGLVENLVSGRAYKPGDILRTRSGKTVEINNTDAEGRLVLADLLDYVCTDVKPDSIVDVATLTGACVVALGPLACAVMSNDEALSESLLAAAGRAGEKAWPMPLYDEYREQLKSDIADLKNTGQRYGGALTAGLFLREFVREGYSWAHIDIAGPAFLESRHPYWGKGGTGFGVGTLVEFVTALSR